MKLFHLSDLHIGKRVNEFSMLAEQQYILDQIVNYVAEEQPDGIILAGDIYDKPVPGADAVALFDWFLTELSERDVFVMMISGNHDSAERIAFGSHLMSKSNVYISPVFSGTIEPIIMKESEIEICFYLLPFVKPAHVRRYFSEEEIESYHDAVDTVIKNLEIDPSQINIAVAHQFITGAARSDSEELSVGGLDNVDAAVFGKFDYVALGHIHRPQNMGSQAIRYCGSPLKYSFSEANHSKSITVVEIAGKGTQQIRQIPLIPRNDLRIIKGSYQEVTAKEFYKDSNVYDYLNVILTDEEDIPEAIGKLRTIYPNIMKLEYDNRRTRETRSIDQNAIEEKRPLDHISTFYQLQNNQPLSMEQQTYLEALTERLWEVNG